VKNFKKSVARLFIFMVALYPSISRASSLVQPTGDGQQPSKTTLFVTTGFPAPLGVGASYRPVTGLSLDTQAELSFGLFLSAGVSAHLPILQHGQHTHGLFLGARGGYVIAGNTVYPQYGAIGFYEGGYAYQNNRVDIRLVGGVNETVYGIKPTLGLRLGWRLQK
jgi:hypothetical protein